MRGYIPRDMLTLSSGASSICFLLVRQNKIRRPLRSCVGDEEEMARCREIGTTHESDSLHGVELICAIGQDIG
jgi:hypothetical protein